MRTCATWWAAAMAAVLFLLVPSARAQDDIIQEAGPLGLPVPWRVLKEGCALVGFDAEQTATAHTLHQGYRGSVKGAMDAMRKKDKELRKTTEGDNPDWAKYSKEREKASQKYAEEMETLETGLLSDVKALCTPAQEAKFSALEKLRRRDKSRVFTLAPGELIDLRPMLLAAKADPGPHAETITTWENNLDKLLIEREKFMRNAMKAMAGDDGPENMAKFFGDFRSVSVRIGDLNRRAAAEIASSLPDTQRAAFENETRLHTFPRIYGESPVSRAIAAAKATKDITSEQKTQLDEIRTAFAKEADPINVRWAAAADEQFRKIGDDMMSMFQMDEEKSAKEPFFVIRKERRALDEKYREKVIAVLNQDQRDALTKADADRHDGYLPEFLPNFEKDMEDRASEWKGDDEAP